MTDDETKETQPQQGTQQRKRLAWVLLSTLLAVGAYAAMFIPAFAGHNIDPISGPSSMVWTGVLGAAIWRYRNRNGWVGFGLGAVLGVLIAGLAAYISGYMGAAINGV